MILHITKHIFLTKDHSTLPKWLFHRDNTILSQTIVLSESNMKELLIFLNHHSATFNAKDLKVSVVEFEDIILEF